MFGEGDFKIPRFLREKCERETQKKKKKRVTLEIHVGYYINKTNQITRKKKERKTRTDISNLVLYFLLHSHICKASGTSSSPFNPQTKTLISLFISLIIYFCHNGFCKIFRQQNPLSSPESQNHHPLHPKTPRSIPNPNTRCSPTLFTITLTTTTNNNNYPSATKP